MARGAVLMEEALRLMERGAPPLVLAHLQFAIDLLRGEGPLCEGSTSAGIIDRQFDAASNQVVAAND